MKIKILSLLLLFVFSAGVFAQNEQVAPQEDKALQRQQERLKKQAAKENKNQEEKEKKELAKQEKEKNKQEKFQKQQEEEQKILLDKQKIEEEQQQAIEKEEQERQAQAQQKKEAKEKKKSDKEEAKIQKIMEKRKNAAKALSQAPKEKVSSLVLDYDLRVRGAYYSNLDYSSKEIISDNIFQQYLSVNVIGKFDERIEMSAKFAAYGISGKYNEIFAMPYNEEDFSFFLENAYLNFKSESWALVPYVLTFGKQYFNIGDGMIIDGNNNGFIGARARADLTDLFAADAFAAKADNLDFNIYGGSIKIKTASVVEIGIYQERNETGFAYQKGVYVDSAPYAIRSDNKTFYDIRITGGNKKYKYRLEAAQQKGELVKISSESIKYDAVAFTAEGSWKGILLNMDSNANILFSYAYAERENAFNPTFAKRYDGLRRVGYGALFAAGNADSFLILPHGYAGINTIGAGFDVMPWAFLQTGLSFYLFSASDAPADAGEAGFASLYGAEADLGNEFDFFIKYKYQNYFDVKLDIAMYTPPVSKAFINSEVSYLYQIEVSAKF